MRSLLLSGILFISLIVLFMKKSKFNLYVILGCTIFILYLLFNPGSAIEATTAGLNLFMYKVFPSLFCFLLLSNLLISYDGVYIYSRVLGRFICSPLKLPSSAGFVLIISALCGYPVGAKYCNELYKGNAFSQKTAERLLNIASNASPLFIVGTVGAAMLNNPFYGYILLLSNYLSCVLMAEVLPSEPINNIPFSKPPSSYKSFIEKLLSSFKLSFNSCLVVSGFVIFFSIVVSIIKNNLIFQVVLNNLCRYLALPKDIVQGFVLGLFEMTNGCNMLALCSGSLIIKLCLISFILAFSGISILLQVYAFSYEIGTPLRKYALRKIFQGILSSIITLIIMLLPVNNKLSVINTPKRGSSLAAFILLIIFISLPVILNSLLFKLKKIH